MNERSWVRVPAGAAGEFLLQCQLFVLILISVSVPPLRYRSSTLKILVILPEAWEACYSYTRMHTTYVALHEVTWSMVVWCTQDAPGWQQFHVTPTTAVL